MVSYLSLIFVVLIWNKGSQNLDANESSGIKNFEENPASKVNQNYELINELSSGQFFGEISAASNLKVTCTVRAVNDVFWGVLRYSDITEHK